MCEDGGGLRVPCGPHLAFYIQEERVMGHRQPFPIQYLQCYVLSVFGDAATIED